ncbi:hypothetical protein A1Q1_00878 [Trichosporon asahii var. asahii CBS 2479]|uniref:Uncharacterized protein n=1 Tax=Trichosporon asahii var. asahii (strain ATCC 90039 / CBS 2479 / JCM 2466 / KCTC 7840 / NBRC 103889/ NCYC 2677 / UAMH 7654) TaxID=1186058 RepID=J4UF55_TRIAS|nr:hypothetical protein A1Q1_00878 [Trichosporon asahii var. asahii CBS 2479]EJT49960.1 hypothetical protein A1Q1_00878 [Trichosporon asahii var. asahii CBS 2479]
MRSPEAAHPPLHSIATDYLGRGPEPQRLQVHVAFADTQSPDGSGEYVPQLTYPPRTEQRYRPDVEAMKDERRLSASTLGSKRESAVPAPEQPRRVRNKFSVWLDRANILWRYSEEQHSGAVDSDDYNARRLPIYLYIFVSAHLVQLILTVFAIRTRNTIQVIALAVFNAMLLVYAGIEVAEIRQTLDVYPASEEVASAHKLLTLPLNILTGIVIGVIGLAEVIIVVLTYFVWREFGWRIYKFLGADLRIRTYYRQYQVFESIVCCSFFFFMSFNIQFLFLILNNKDPEYVLTWVMLPLSFLWLAFGLVCARREWRVAMGVFLVGLLAGMAYFIFKLVRVWQNVALYYKLGYDHKHTRRAALALLARAGALPLIDTRDVDTGNSLMDTVKSYYSVRKSLTVFSALSLVMICLCIGYGVVVWLNFGKGLREHVDEGRKPGIMADLAPATFKPVSSNPASPNRLTID